MIKDKLINFGLIFILGAIGGILGSQLLFPWMAGIGFLRNIDWIRQAGEGTTVINRTERVVVTENEALEDAIDKCSGVIVGVMSEQIEKMVAGKKIILEKPEILAQGTGFIASSDGLIVTALNLIPDSAQKILIVYNSRQIEAEIKKTDEASGITILKINENNLPVLPFAEKEPRLGEQFFLIGVKPADFDKFIDLSIATQVSPFFNIGFSGKEIIGSPIFNLKGEIAGLNWADSAGLAKITRPSEIRQLLK